MDQLRDKSEFAQISKQIAGEVNNLATFFDRDVKLWQTGDLARPTAEKLRDIAAAFAIYEPQDILSRLGNLLSIMAHTVRQYGFLGEAESQTTMAYIDACSAILEKIGVQTVSLELDEQFNQLLSRYGTNAGNVMEYSTHLMKIYKSTLSEQNLPQRRKGTFRTAAYGTVVDPGVLATLGIQPTTVEPQPEPDDDEGKTDRRFLPAIQHAITEGFPHTVQSPSPQVNGHYPLLVPRSTASTTMLGIGVESEKALRQMGAANPIQVPVHQVPDSLAALSQALENEEETTTVDNKALDAAIKASQEVLTVENSPIIPSKADATPISPLPAEAITPQSTPIEPSANRQIISVFPPAPVIVQVPVPVKVDSVPPIKPVPLTSPTPIPGVSPNPAPAPQTAPFTTEWVNQEGQKYGHEKPLYNRAPLPPTTPAATQSSTKTKILWALAGVLGLASLSGGGYALSKQFSSDQTPESTVASASVTPTQSATPSSTPVEKVTEKKVETTTPSEKGMFKMNTEHAAYKNYLESIKGATGLIGKIRDVAGQTKVDFYENPADLEKAQKDGFKAISSKESELNQRIALLDTFLDRAIKQSSDNHWVVTYFTDIQTSFNNYKATGKWLTQIENRSVAADKFFAAFQAPLKFAADKEIIGFAPSTDPSIGALGRMKKAAPTFYLAYLQAGERMQKETDPKKIVRYDDFNLIKDATCKEIQEVKKGYDAVAQGGISYMRSSWCDGPAGETNYLNQALKFTVPIKAVTPAAMPAPAPRPNAQPAPSSSPTYNNIIQQNNLNPYTLPPSPQPAVKQPKSGIISRAVDSVKSFFGFGKKSVPAAPQMPVQPQYSQPISSNEYVYTKKDIPMYTLGEQLKNMFWG